MWDPLWNRECRLGESFAPQPGRARLAAVSIELRDEANNAARRIRSVRFGGSARRKRDTRVDVVGPFGRCVGREGTHSERGREGPQVSNG